MAVYERYAGAHVAERARPVPGSDAEARYERLAEGRTGGWRRVEDPREAGEGSGSGPDVRQRPARSASKGDWLAYARGQAADSSESAALGGLTKDQLIEQYGGES